MKPSSDRGSAGPTRAGAGRRAAAVLALALLDAGCGSDDVSSPVAPTAPDPVVPTLVNIAIANAPAAGLRADALRQFLDEWEAENGALTTDELRRAEGELGPSDGGEPAVAPSTRRPRRAPARR